MKRAGTVPWPEHEAARYTEAGYWRGRPLGDWMWSWSESYGTRTALVDGATGSATANWPSAPTRWRSGSRRSASADGRQHARPAAQPLGVRGAVPGLPAHRRGTGPGPACRTASTSWSTWPNSPTSRPSPSPTRCRGFDHQALAAKIAGTRPRPVPVLVAGDHVAPGHVDLRAALRDRGRRRGAQPARLDERAPDAGEVALFLLSGGTTGLPKIIARTHDDYEYNFRRSGEICGLRRRDRLSGRAARSRTTSRSAARACWARWRSGGRAVLSPSPHPRTAFAEIARERVTVTSVVPAVAQRWLEHAADTAARPRQPASCSRSAARVLPAELARELGPGLGCTLQQVYGMAEGLLNYTRPGRPAGRSCARPRAGR